VRHKKGDLTMQKPVSPSVSRIAAASTIAFLLAASAAFAQSADSGPSASSEPAATEGQLQEVIVTGTKRELASQDVPIAISAISQQELDRVPQNDIRALGSLAPGLVLSNPAGFNAAGGGMRGTGTNIILVTQDAPVSFLMDDFVLSQVTSQFLTLFDTQQIEVYRGPQGTLFGKNTTGGVISITSKRPVLNEFSSDAEVGYGQYENGANTTSVKAALNLPLGSTMAFRLAAIYDNDDGYYTDDKRTSTFPANVPLWQAFGIAPGTLPPPEVPTTVFGSGGRLGGKDVFAARAKLLWEPNDTYAAYFIFEGVRDRSDSPPGVNESSATDLLTLLGFPGITKGDDVFSTLITHNNNGILEDVGHKVDTEGVYLTQTLAVPGGEIKSITGYREQRQQLPSTYTGEAFETLFDSTRNTERFTTQQELRYVSKLDGPLNFVAGGNYFHDTFDFLAFFSVGLTSLVPVVDPDTGTFVRPDGRVSLDTRALSDYQFQGTRQTRDEYALFWDGTYAINSQWNFTAGIRYSKDKKDFLRFVDGGGPCTALTDPRDAVTVAGECRDTRSQYISRAGLQPKDFDQRNIPLPLSAFGTIVNTDGSWNKTTYRAVLDYKPVEHQMYYLSYATGFLSGGFSETCATPSRCDYNPETNKNLEIGYKGDLLNRTLRFNAAAYLTKYSNLQRAVVAAYTAADGTSQQETVTVNTGSSKAYGVDLEMMWLPVERLRLSAALNWLHHEYRSGILPDLRGTNSPIDLTQFDVPFSPKWKAAFGVGYDWPLADGRRMSLDASANYQAKAETDVFNGVDTQMESRTLLDLGLTYHDRDDRWAVTAYGANLTDETYRVAALPVAGLWNFTNYGPPRSYGVKLNVRFKGD
jgi:iron complex outermembrane receptor protein